MYVAKTTTGSRDVVLENNFRLLLIWKIIERRGVLYQCYAKVMGLEEFQIQTNAHGR